MDINKNDEATANKVNLQHLDSIKNKQSLRKETTRNINNDVTNPWETIVDKNPIKKEAQKK